MKEKSPRELVYGWETVRYELLNSRLCDLDVKIEGSPLSRRVQSLHVELKAKGLTFRPLCYLSDGWGCPDKVPAIGIPFYLADERLARLEEEQSGEVEETTDVMMLLRHEAGHAYNYAFRLYESPEWEKLFGPFSAPYRESFRPNPYSKQFVRHISAFRVGRSYAQKHPDEDFAETFAVWLTPRSAWRRRYRLWPAIEKLKYVDRVMRKLRGVRPTLKNSMPLHNALEDLTFLVKDHYGKRTERYRAAAQGYVDDILTEMFPIDGPERTRVDAAPVLRTHRWEIVRRVSHWTGLEDTDIYPLLTKMEERATELGLRLRRTLINAKMLEFTAVITTLAMNYVYTGRYMVTRTQENHE